jgi:hypothetical protein
MNQSQNGRGTNSSDGEEDEDRKPPARVYIRKCDENDDEVVDETLFTSTQSSLASPSSSINQTMQPYSPVAHRQQRRNRDDDDDDDDDGHEYDDVNIVILKRGSTPSKSTQKQNKIGSFFQTPLKQEKAAVVPSLTAATPYTPDQSFIPQPPPPQLDSILTSLRYQIVLWIFTLAVTVIVFLSQVLPATAFAALLFGVASTGMFSQSMILALRRLYREIVFHGNGLAEWIRLPESLIQTLTQTSIHEYMTDPSFMLEYRHMALYFLPLSAQQLEQSIAQLAPQHRDRLYRPAGIGRALLGDDIMRVLMGDARWRQTLQNEQPQESLVSVMNNNDNSNTGTPIPRVSVPSRQQRMLLPHDDDNEESEIASSSDTPAALLDVSSMDRFTNERIRHEQAVNVVARLGLDSDHASSTIPTLSPIRVLTTGGRRNVMPQPQQQQQQQEEETVDQFADRELQVLVDAMWGSLYGFVLYPIRDYVASSIVVPAVTTVSTAWTRLGMGLTFGSFALGVWGFWTGIYSWPSISMLIVGNATHARERMRYPSSETVWTTAFLSGASVGLALFARQYTRNNFGNSQERDKRSDDVSNSPRKDE